MLTEAPALSIILSGRSVADPGGTCRRTVAGCGWATHIDLTEPGKISASSRFISSPAATGYHVAGDHRVTQTRAIDVLAQCHVGDDIAWGFRAEPRIVMTPTLRRD